MDPSARKTWIKAVSGVVIALVGFGGVVYRVEHDSPKMLRIVGNVRSEAGDPIPGGHVEIVDETGASQGTPTDSFGTFHADIPVGTKTVHIYVQARGFEAHDEEFTPSQNRIAQVVLVSRSSPAVAQKNDAPPLSKTAVRPVKVLPPVPAKPEKTGSGVPPSPTTTLSAPNGIVVGGNSFGTNTVINNGPVPMSINAQGEALITQAMLPYAGSKVVIFAVYGDESEAVAAAFQRALEGAHLSVTVNKSMMIAGPDMKPLRPGITLASSDATRAEVQPLAQALFGAGLISQEHPAAYLNTLKMSDDALWIGIAPLR